MAGLIVGIVGMFGIVLIIMVTLICGLCSPRNLGRLSTLPSMHGPGPVVPGNPVLFFVRPVLRDFREFRELSEAR